jgi:hypothetical protein
MTPERGAFSNLGASLYRSPSGGTRVFALPSLHRKIPFLTRNRRPGSMTTVWGFGSLVPSVSTIQSSQTADFHVDCKEPFLRGFLTSIFKFPVSADIDGLLGGFLACGLCIQKFRSRRLDCDYYKRDRVVRSCFLAPCIGVHSAIISKTKRCPADV